MKTIDASTCQHKYDPDGCCMICGHLEPDGEAYSEIPSVQNIAKVTELIKEAKKEWEGGTNNIDRKIAEHIVKDGKFVPQKTALWNIIEEPNCVDTLGRPCKHAECSACGFTWDDLYVVEKYFYHCPQCGARAAYTGPIHK